MGWGSTPGGGNGSSSAGPPPYISSSSTSTELVRDPSSKFSPSDQRMLLGISIKLVTLALTRILPLRASSFSQVMILPNFAIAVAISSVFQWSKGTPTISSQHTLLNFTLLQFLPSLCLVNVMKTSPKARGLSLTSLSLSRMFLN